MLTEQSVSSFSCFGGHPDETATIKHDTAANCLYQELDTSTRQFYTAFMHWLPIRPTLESHIEDRCSCAEVYVLMKDLQGVCVRFRRMHTSNGGLVGSRHIYHFIVPMKYNRNIIM